ncbi:MULTISPECIES: pilus assembly protein TadG-related protein [unclassified Bradyrhizobium]|uniref:pilus assembly protein TadG-related protein n=1 Tax=unclassified Bradyrhizobium TaxID=2631580 RepID=UPI001BA773FF|nr:MULTISPECIES: pilus assembly protein TadG-related protein [unclassified Bradyrhizobium]MBR1205521.1 hypothetical protein [Bradyrhizobium sp. AUGA SZCCT0124]MBR1314030.1 hypothetical protein [Bradyrhizobium sp. AUGA SZCCT0051]MBR1337848.1 hypothetical protein [Bradyrhizobium sp. AUGA SZCCT0105]MBR1360089.1 hypothetical protein [Bradyrhizobium sp. AUGA SZCCT0045]
MRNVLRCRRGSAAFATAVAMIPMIGALALGGEAGGWYVTQQRAQNAADAAAYSGALRVACTIAGGVGCDTAQDYIYRGKQFAAQNTFCNSGDTSYPGSKCSTSLPTGISQNVQIASLSSWGGTAGSYVQATVSQTQPTYMAKLVGVSTVTIGAVAVAAIKNPTNPCVLALNGPISFQDNGISVNSPNCGFASNFTGPGASIDFKNVSSGNVSLGASQASGTCTGTAALCQNVSTYMPPVVDPYTALNAALSSLSLPACGAGPGGAPVAYTVATPCANKDYSINGSTCSAGCTLSGTYFFSGTDFSMKGNSSSLVAGAAGATIILLPGVATGKSNHINMTLKAPNTTPAALPASLQPYAALIGATAIYDTETDAKKFTGITTITITNGIMYYPNQSLTFSGNSSIDVNGCSELIAKQITFAGSVNFTQKGCPKTALPTSQLVRLVQ